MAYIHPSVVVGPGVLIGKDVSIEAGCSIGAYSIIEGDTHIGPDNRFFPHAIIGGEPQDHKFKGGGRLVVGSVGRLFGGVVDLMCGIFLVHSALRV